MATLTIHNIPNELLKKLERSAHENRRAVDEEAVLWLSRVETPASQEVQSADEDYAYRIIPTKSADPTKPEHRLESNASESSREPDPWLERAKALRDSMPDVYIGDEEELNRFKREGRLGESGSAYGIVPSRFASPMKPEEFIEYTQRLSRKLEGKVWATEEEVNRVKREGRL